MKQYFRQLNDSEIIEQSDYVNDLGNRHVKYCVVGMLVKSVGIQFIELDNQLKKKLEKNKELRKLTKILIHLL